MERTLRAKLTIPKTNKTWEPIVEIRGSLGYREEMLESSSPPKLCNCFHGKCEEVENVNIKVTTVCLKVPDKK